MLDVRHTQTVVVKRLGVEFSRYTRKDGQSSEVGQEGT
jgi:hypothetical protein